MTAAMEVRLIFSSSLVLAFGFGGEVEVRIPVGVARMCCHFFAVLDTSWCLRWRSVRIDGRRVVVVVLCVSFPGVLLLLVLLPAGFNGA